MDYLRPSFADPANRHIDQDCSELTGHHKDALFFNCTFDKVNDLILENCVLDRSTFAAEKLQDLLGLTITLDCHSFNGVTLSRTAFDAILMLLVQTKGNDDRKVAIHDLLGRERFVELRRAMKRTE